jgi:hypothetical protein
MPFQMKFPSYLSCLFGFLVCKLKIVMNVDRIIHVRFFSYDKWHKAYGKVSKQWMIHRSFYLIWS